MLSELLVLSAGAVKPGLEKVIAAFERTHAARVRATFATAPALLDRIKTGAAPDVLIAPEAVFAELSGAEKLVGRETAVIGRIGVGVLVRTGRSMPRIDTVDHLKRSLVDADSLVYNRASTGTYLEKLFASLGVAEAIRNKSIRYADFGAVLEHIRRGEANEIGFGATTVIIENQNRGVEFAGALPAEVQNYTTYTAAAIASEDRREAAGQFIGYVKCEIARKILQSAGIG